MQRSKASVKWLRKMAKKFKITLLGDGRNTQTKNRWAEQIAEAFLDVLIQTYDKVKSAIKHYQDCPVYMGDYQLFMPVKLYWKHNNKFAGEISTDLFNKIYYRCSSESKNKKNFVNSSQEALQAISF